MLPRHVWEPIVGSDAQGPQGLRPGRAPADRGRRLLLRAEVRQEGHDDPRAQPGLLRPEAARRRRRHHLVRELRRHARGAQEQRPRLRRLGAADRRELARQVGRHPGRQGPGLRGARLRLQLESEEEEEPRAARSQAARRALARLRPQADHRRRLPRPRRSARDVPDADLGALHEHRAAAREVRPRARQQHARQARLQARLGRHPPHAGRQLAPDVLRRDHAHERRRHQPRVRDRARLVPEDRRQAHAARLRRHDGVRRDHEAEEPVPRLRPDDVGLGRLRRSRLHALGRRLRPVRRLERHRPTATPPTTSSTSSRASRPTRSSASRSSGRCRTSSTATSRTSSSRSCS